MSTFSTTLGMMAFFSIASLVMVVISFPMMERRVKPNPWYGFRTRKTLNDERIWYEVNAYAGRRLFVVGVVNVLGAIVLFLIPALREDLALYDLAFFLICCLGMFWAISSSMRYMNSL